ncbi:MAG: cation diffusion facilitator family transporter [Rhodothermales bacterium]
MQQRRRATLRVSPDGSFGPGIRFDTGRFLSLPPERMGHHHHHHGRTDAPSQGGERRLLFSIALNLLITLAEVIGGVLSGSLALLSDALHNFSDTMSLGISLGTRRIGRREATPHKTFGYKRAEIIGAFVNLVTLVLIALFLIKEAVERFLDPQPIDGTIMLVVAVIGLAANVLTAGLLYRDAKGSLNIRSAFMHILADAVSSVGVVLGGVLILYFDVYIVDPILTMLISLYILYHSYEMLRETVDILMESVPKNIDLDEILTRVQAIDRVRDMHHLHVWQLDEHDLALEAHIVIDKCDLEHMEAVKHTIKQRLEDVFHIHHSTLEFEFVPCDEHSDPRCFDTNDLEASAPPRFLPE